MKLTKTDKEYLKEIGYLDEDMWQIEKATTKTVYTLDGTKISCDRAIELLGRERYLSSLGRSAFHWNTSKETLDGKSVVRFDSSKLFK